MATLRPDVYYPNIAPAPGSVQAPDDSTPTLFTPIKIRGLQLHNRIVVSPMGTFSAKDGHLTDFHLVHLGSYALRGAALTMVEATGVLPNGRTSPGDSGLWKDSQIAPLKRVVDFIHSQGQKAAIQLYHTGRKASMLAPWMKTGATFTNLPLATEADGGWPDDIWAPSAIPFMEGYPVPKEMTVGMIDTVVQAFGDSARRAVEAGIDLIELHGAHGYIITQFLSPLTNHRTDEYGGSFENRTRFLFRVLKAMRAVMPNDMPLSLRISAIEWMEWSGIECWTLEDSIRLAKLLPGVGVDILDVSSGGNHPEQKIKVFANYQVELAEQIRKAIRKDGLDLLIAAVGMIDNAEMAESIVQTSEPETDGLHSGDINAEEKEPKAHLVFVGREFLRRPNFVLDCAKTLGVEVQWPLQYLAVNKKQRQT